MLGPALRNKSRHEAWREEQGVGCLFVRAEKKIEVGVV